MQKNYNENLVAGAAIRDDKGRRISKLFEAPHPKMTVGYARNLIMPSDPEEQEFNFRQSGGGVIEDGLAVIDKVKGNSVVWNQLFDGTRLKASGTVNGITFTYENGVITANGTATNNSFSDQGLGRQKIKLIKGHKYIFAEKTSNENAYVQLYTGETEEGFSSIALTNKTVEIQTCDYTSSGSYADGWLIRVRVASGTTLTNAKFRMPFTDLTQMFGAGNEPTTYEEFLQRKPKVEDEYAYNEGTIVNNKVEEIKTTDANGNEIGRLDLSWVKDIKDAEGVKLFENGMKSAGTAFDEVVKNKAVKRLGVKVFDGTESFIDYLVQYGSFAIIRDAFVGAGSTIGISNRYVVSRFWESDPDRTKYDKQIYIDSINNRVWIRDSAFADVDSLKQHLADLYAAGTPLVVYYELAEPIEVEYDEKNLTYPVVAGGTEEAIASEPSSAFRADVGYGIDAVKTILDLKARVEALEGK